MKKTIGEWIEYYTERYGRHYRIRIEKPDIESVRVYYWWDKIPEQMLELPAKRVWSHPYIEEHGIHERELEFIY